MSALLHGGADHHLAIGPGDQVNGAALRHRPDGPADHGHGRVRAKTEDLAFDGTHRCDIAVGQAAELTGTPSCRHHDPACCQLCPVIEHDPGYSLGRRAADFSHRGAQQFHAAQSNRLGERPQQCPVVHLMIASAQHPTGYSRVEGRLQPPAILPRKQLDIATQFALDREGLLQRAVVIGIEGDAEGAVPSQAHR